MAAKVAAVFVALLAVSGCGSVDQPRWSSTDATRDVAPQDFASPRSTVLVVASPGDAAVEFNGRVRARSFTEVVAPNDGVLVDLVFDRGSFVEAGQVLVEAETVPSEAELLAVEILQLEAELAIAEGRPNEEVDAAQQELEAARAALAPVPFTIEAPVAGMLGLPDSSGRDLVAGEPVVLIADPTSLVVEVPLDAERRSGIDVGARVTVAAASGADSQVESSVIERIIEPDDPSDPAIASIPVTGDAVSLGEAVEVIAEISTTPDGAWLPASAVTRRNGASSVLVSGETRLERVPVVVGRRAGGYVELLEGPALGSTIVVPL